MCFFSLSFITSTCVFFSYLSSLFYHSLLIISLILYNWFPLNPLFSLISIIFAILVFAVAFSLRLFKSVLYSFAYLRFC